MGSCVGRSSDTPPSRGSSSGGGLLPSPLNGQRPLDRVDRLTAVVPSGSAGSQPSPMFKAARPSLGGGNNNSPLMASTVEFSASPRSARRTNRSAGQLGAGAQRERTSPGGGSLALAGEGKQSNRVQQKSAASTEVRVEKKTLNVLIRHSPTGAGGKCYER